MPRGRDLLGIVEAAYRLDVTEEEWTTALAEAAARCLDTGLGVSAYVYDASDLAHFQHGVLAFAGRGSPDRFGELLESMAENGLPPVVVDQLYSASPATVLLTETIREGGEAGVLRSMKERGARDAIGIRCADPSRRGCVIVAASARPRPLSARLRASLDRVAAHVAAAHRLRLAGPEPIDDASAIFDATGRPQHFRTEVEESGRRALFAAVERRRAARSLRRSSPEQAVETWRGLVSGEWSIIDHADRDGKRFILARRNEPSVRDLRALTVREQQVAAYCALGHSLKLVAYELGIGVPTVSEHLRRALRKLGLRSRWDLERIFGATTSE